jgi:hypothetical protein
MGFVRIKILLWLATAGAVIATAVTPTNFAGRSTNPENFASTKTTHVSAIDSQESDRAGDEAPSRIQVVLVALRPEGFEPAEMRLSSGEYLFVVRNRTGLDEVNVHLTSQSSQQLLTARVGASRQALKRRLQLTSGTYHLTEADHPEWTCTIVVRQ